MVLKTRITRHFQKGVGIKCCCLQASMQSVLLMLSQGDIEKFVSPSHGSFDGGPIMQQFFNGSEEKKPKGVILSTMVQRDSVVLLAQAKRSTPHCIFVLHQLSCQKCGHEELSCGIQQHVDVQCFVCLFWGGGYLPHQHVCSQLIINSKTLY